MAGPRIYEDEEIVVEIMPDEEEIIDVAARRFLEHLISTGRLMRGDELQEVMWRDGIFIGGMHAQRLVADFKSCIHGRYCPREAGEALVRWAENYALLPNNGRSITLPRHLERWVWRLELLRQRLRGGMERRAAEAGQGW